MCTKTSAERRTHSAEFFAHPKIANFKQRLSPKAKPRRTLSHLHPETVMEVGA
jgi:hypothetical protein